MKNAVTILCFLIVVLAVVPVGATQQDSRIQPCSFPSSFSWRNINGTDYTTPIKDQSPAPTCEAYGICASLETQIQYLMGEPYGPDLSEVHLYFYAGGTIAEGYVNLIDAAHYLIDYGVPDEGCFPDPHRNFDFPYESLPGWENRTVKISEWGWVPHDIDSIKEALITHGPLVTCISLWKDFMYYHSGVYKHRWGARVGGHVVAIVGYDDAQSCWILKNSWGTTWGEQGWFRISYDANMFATWYGNGTGIMYVDGVYGNLSPPVPKVAFETPKNYKTYLWGHEIPTLLKKLPIQIAAARIFGRFTVTVATEHTTSVDFYIDDVLQYHDDAEPFLWDLTASHGLHTLMVKAYNNDDVSLDVIDVYIL